jgi:hypothetical protein
MQNQQQTNNNTVHVKVSYNNEFRRFLLNPVSFEHLYTTLRSLFELPADFRIKFQDDENDWVLLSTDTELVYATELSGSPLRLQVKLSLPETPAQVGSPDLPTGRGGRARGRGCRGGGRGGLTRSERLMKKSSRLSERISVLEEKLSSDKLTSDRRRVLTWKLEKVKENLVTVKMMNEELSQNCQEKTLAQQSSEVSVSDSELTPIALIPEETSVERVGCRGRRGRGGAHSQAWRNKGESDQPLKKGKTRINPEILANFRQCKEDLRVARESKDAELIKTCLEKFHVAKASRLEALAALKAEDVASCNDEQEQKA